MNAVARYREAAVKLYGISREEAEEAIVAPADDTGEWAPGSLAVIYLEYGHTQPISYWSNGALDACLALSCAAGVGYVEYVNAAVAAVYEL